MFYVGLNPGQLHDHSAVTIVVRRVERLALGTPYPEVVRRVREIVC